MRIQEVESIRKMSSVVTIDAGSIKQVVNTRTRSVTESDHLVDKSKSLAAVSYNFSDFSLPLEQSNDPKTTAQVLSNLALDSHDLVRKQVASNPNTSPQTLSKLLKDHNFDVLLRVAGNLNSPESALYQLSQHKHSEIRIRVARNVNTSQTILSVLLQDEDFRVRSYVSSNINKQRQVALTATAKEKTKAPTNKALLALLEDNNPIIRASVARNVSTPVKLLAHLAKDSSNLVRINVAGNLNTETIILLSLSADKDDVVRSTVASNPHTPTEVLSELILDKVRAVRMSVLLNPKASDEIISLIELIEKQQKEQKNKQSRLRRKEKTVNFEQPKAAAELTVSSSKPTVIESVWKNSSGVRNNIKKIGEQAKTLISLHKLSEKSAIVCSCRKILSKII